MTKSQAPLIWTPYIQYLCCFDCPPPPPTLIKSTFRSARAVRRPLGHCVRRTPNLLLRPSVSQCVASNEYSPTLFAAHAQRARSPPRLRARNNLRLVISFRYCAIGFALSQGYDNSMKYTSRSNTAKIGLWRPIAWMSGASL